VDRLRALDNNLLVPIMSWCDTTSSMVTGRYFSTLRYEATLEIYKFENKLAHQGKPLSSSGKEGSAALPLPFSAVEKRGRSASTISTSSSDAIASRSFSMRLTRNARPVNEVADAEVAEPGVAASEFELYFRSRQNFWTIRFDYSPIYAFIDDSTVWFVG
jgi:hypothetical protein